MQIELNEREVEYLQFLISADLNKMEYETAKIKRIKELIPLYLARDKVTAQEILKKVLE